jgi:lipid II:glycine glycyltransferase (peptidoglycan interpeptide bridge formation enzyme)
MFTDYFNKSTETNTKKTINKEKNVNILFVVNELFKHFITLFKHTFDKKNVIFVKKEYFDAEFI